MPLAPGTRLGPYEIVAPIGAGGMGEVYRARDPRLGREVALKVLPEAFASDAQRRARFEREARSASALNHPNIVTIYDIGGGDSILYVAMELVEGKTLRDVLAGGPLPSSTLLDLAAQIASGLAKAHGAGIIHRDMKPENVIVSADGHVKILDFGLAKLQHPSGAPTELELSAVMTAEAALTEVGVMLGTVAYMSPEQAQGKPVDARSDVFSLGIILYEMSTGRRPFGGDNGVSILSAILRDTPAPITESRPAAPAGLDRIVRRCLEKAPEERYPDAHALRDELLALRADLASESGRPARKTAASRGRWIAAGTLAALLLAALGSWWLARSARGRWVRNEALPELAAIVDRIQGLQEGRESWDAYLLARRIEAVAPDEPLLERLRPRFTREITITSDPPGAAVHARYYDEPEAEPVFIGTTPLEKVRYPLGFTRIQLTLAGRRPVDDVIWNFAPGRRHLELHAPPPDEVPEEMVWIPGGAFELYLPGLDHLKPEPTGAFYMDRHEVSQRDYRRFVEAGGYSDPKYWRQPFIDGGREMSWQEAMARFTDRTGRPGPATWEVGAYPEGAGDLPVSGVSWYEAAAYAEWAGKSLPTIFHWNRAAFTVASSRIVPLANLGGTGPSGSAPRGA